LSLTRSTARAVTKTPKFHQITPILKSLHWLKINERIKYDVLSLTYKSLKIDQPSYLRSLLSFPSHRCTRSSSLITLSRLSLTSRLKRANRSFYHSAPVLWNNLPSHLRHVVHHVTPSPITNSPVSDLSISPFLKKLKTHLFHSSLFLSYLVCIHLGYLRTDISGIDQASSFISHTFRYYSPSYHSIQCLCYLTCKFLWISGH